MYTAKSLKDKKLYRIFIQKNIYSKTCFSLSFNNHFIKAMRSKPIFQKQKNYFVFL